MLQVTATGNAGRSCHENDLEPFLVKLGLDAYLQTLTGAGFDLGTLVKGSAQGAAFSITPNQLWQATQQQIPIGSCFKIMQEAEVLLQQSQRS